MLIHHSTGFSTAIPFYDRTGRAFNRGRNRVILTMKWTLPNRLCYLSCPYLAFFGGLVNKNHFFWILCSYVFFYDWPILWLLPHLKVKTHKCCQCVTTVRVVRFISFVKALAQRRLHYTKQSAAKFQLTVLINWRDKHNLFSILYIRMRLCRVWQRRPVCSHDARRV